MHGNGCMCEVSNPFQSQRKDMLDMKFDQGHGNEPLQITIDLDYFPHQPKNNKNCKSYEKKNGTQYFNVSDYSTLKFVIIMCFFVFC